MQPLIKAIDFVCSKCRASLKGATGPLIVCPHCGEFTVPMQRVFGTVRTGTSTEGLCTRMW